MFYSTKYDSPVGKLTLAADGAALNGLWIEGQKYFGDTIPEEMTERGGLPVFDAAKAWLDRYFAGKAPLQCELPLAPTTRWQGIIIEIGLRPRLRRLPAPTWTLCRSPQPDASLCFRM